MNEVARIHLARVSYEIDIEAKKELEKYLGAVKKSLGKEADAMEDIEIRMTEILAERGVNKDSVITQSDIEAIIAQLGEPDGFASEEEAAESKSEPDEKVAKKYYRDTDHAVLGGVVAGLAAYTGWDVTLLRILAVILTIIPSWGTLIIVYIVVWICAPEAKSVSEKMEMRGEAINLDSIKESAKKFGEKAEVAGREMSAKAGKVGKKIEKEAPAIGSKIGRVILMILGITGVVISSVTLIGITISCVWVIPLLIGLAGLVDHAALLVVAVGLAFGCIFTLCLFGISLSAMFIDGKPKNHQAGLLVSIIIAFALLMGAIGTGASWLTVATSDSIQHVKEAVHKKVTVNIDGVDCDDYPSGKMKCDKVDNVKIEAGPFRLNVDNH
jgi:phage shock protein PspC (stress-responsive transcriptional regulator)